MYLNGNSTKEISKVVNVSTRQVLNVLHIRGVVLEGRRRTGGSKINVDFFKTWTNEMAYVVGFIYTDGGVSGNALTITQNERYILEKINAVMDSDYKITSRANGKNDIYVLTISRKEIIGDLLKLGVTEGKSRIMTFPDVPSEFLPHFIRGVIDGDGWVQNRGYVMNITNASERFSHALHNELTAKGYNGRITQQDNAYRVWVSGKHDVIELADWIYDNSGDLHLSRKHDRFYINKETTGEGSIAI